MQREVNIVFILLKNFNNKNDIYLCVWILYNTNFIVCNIVLWANKGRVPAYYSLVLTIQAKVLDVWTNTWKINSRWLNNRSINISLWEGTAWVKAWRLHQTRKRYRSSPPCQYYKESWRNFFKTKRKEKEIKNINNKMAITLYLSTI